VSRLLGLYPQAWRARYGDEFAELLAARPPSLRDRLDIVVGAIDARINPQVPAAGDRERLLGGDRTARSVAIVTGVLLTIWGVIGATSMVPWESNLAPAASAELVNLASVSGMIGSLLAPVTFGIVIARYGRVLGGAGVAGAILTAVGLLMSALGMGMAALLALAAGATLFSWRANGRILSAPIAMAFAAGSLLSVAAFVLFAAGGGQDVRLLLPVVALGPSWVLFGFGLRAPRPEPNDASTRAPRLAGA
jgi:MFS family permease